MNLVRTPILAALALVAAAAVVVGGAERSGPAALAQASPTPYHEGQPAPVAPQSTMLPTVVPLPEPSDRPTADMMATGGAAMVGAAGALEAAAAAMAESGNPTLVELDRHWREDSRALRERGAWMVITATSSGMVHDPDRAHEIDVWNLKAGGVTMAAEGEAMAAHGREMQAQAVQLREQGALATNLAADLVGAGQSLIDQGEALAQDGERMERYADGLIRSLGLQP